MWDDYVMSFRTNPEAPQPHPISDDAWSAEAIAATLPPAILAAQRAARRPEARR
jgi:hypothetical protein